MAEETKLAFVNEIGTYGSMPIKDQSVQEVAQVDLKEIEKINPEAAKFIASQQK